MLTFRGRSLALSVAAGMTSLLLRMLAGFNSIRRFNPSVCLLARLHGQRQLCSFPASRPLAGISTYCKTAVIVFNLRVPNSLTHSSAV